MQIGVLSVWASFIQLVGYGTGFLRAWWLRCVCGRNEELQAFVAEGDTCALGLSGNRSINDVEVSDVIGNFKGITAEKCPDAPAE